MAGFPKFDPPRPAAKRPRRNQLHGVSLTDEFAYFRDGNDPAVKAYINEERTYACKVLDSLRPLRTRLMAEMRSRTRQEDQSLPEYDNGYWYYSRWRRDKDYPLHCRRFESMQAEEEVYLDENELAADTEYFDLASFAVSPDSARVIYAVDMEGDERYQLRVRDLSTARDHMLVSNVAESFAWSEDGQAIFYVGLDENERSFAVFVHRNGPQQDDQCLYLEPDPAFYVDLWKSRSRQFLFIESHSNTSSEIRFLEADGSHTDVRLIEARRSGVEYYADHQGDHLLILTSDQAENFRLMKAPLDRPTRADWAEVMPARSSVVLSYFEPYRDFIAIGELCQGRPRFGVIRNGSSQVTYPQVDDVYTCVTVEDSVDYGSGYLKVSLSAPCRPEEIWAYEVATGDWSLLKCDQVNDFVVSRYDCKRFDVTARDGAPVPVTLFGLKQAMTDVRGPLLMYGYAAYGDSLDMDFDPDLISLLDRGVLVAYVHARGGGELGRAWHHAGRVENKQKSVDDFVDCAKWLVAQGFGEAGGIAAWAGSAGAVMVAEAVRRCPNLFCSLVLEAPFVDVIGTLLDPSLPMTVHDREEFGDPYNATHFAHMLCFSPYENVASAYPPLLVTAGINDRRVGYWEPLKWVARVRDRQSSHVNPILLRIEDGGHYGRSGRSAELEDTAEVYAFILGCLSLGDNELPAEATIAEA